MIGRLWYSSILPTRQLQYYRCAKLRLCRRSMSDKHDPSSEEQQESACRALEAVAREDRLDFATAAKILMTTPAKERKFGWDFHLVQFFFACLPPLAAYLVAQYSRYEQRHMMKERDAKLEIIIDAEFETEVESELQEAAVILSTNDTDLSSLRLRLDAMEERLKQFESVVPRTQIADITAKATAKYDVERVNKQSTDDVLHAQTSQKDPEEIPKQPSKSEEGGIGNSEKKHGDNGYWKWWRGKIGIGADKKIVHEQDAPLGQQSCKNQI